MSLSFYEKAFANNYEELITYYPAFYQQVYEMQEILKAQGKLADGIEAGIERAYLNNFIDYADAETIGNLEVFLKLGHNRTRELEMRRRIVKAHFVGNGKMSATLIKSMLQTYTEAEIDVELKARETAAAPGSPEEKVYTAGEQALYITLFRDGTTKIFTSDILELLKNRLPAHLMFVLSDYTGTTADCRGMEKIFLPHMCICVHAPFWNVEYLDGTKYLDGSDELNSARGHRKTDTEILSRVNTGKELIGEGGVVSKINLHFMDGSLLFSSGTTMNSFYKKEAF